MAPHNVYPCDGHDQWVAIAVRSDEEWASMVEAMESPEWAKDPRLRSLRGRKDCEVEVDSRVAAWTRRRSPWEATRILQAAGVPAGPVMSVTDLAEDPHLSQREFVVEMDHAEVGKRRVAGLPARFSAMPRLAYAPAPLLGQHNEWAFRELLGMAESEVGQLVEDRVIY